MSRPVVIVLIGAFYPGHESAGPNISVKAMCETLADEFDFRIIARDRPPGADAPIVQAGLWHEHGYARIRYLPVGRAGAIGLAALLRKTPHDLLLTNGFFDREFTIPALVARRLGRVPRRPVLLSPRGEFSSGALGLKPARKAAYRLLVDRLGLMRDVVFHVTSQEEESDIRAAFPHHPIRRIGNIRPLFALPDHAPAAPSAMLRLAFLGRISPVKGLDFALRALARVTTPVHYSIYGPISDPVHWAQCEALIAQLPPHVSAAHAGELANSAVGAAMAAQDMLLLPSKSENFGHAIFESLCAGTPVMIGEKTPWRGLEAEKAGFDLPIGDPLVFAQAIDRFAAMDGKERAEWRDGARALAEKFVAKSTAVADMAVLMHRLSSQKSAAARIE